MKRNISNVLAGSILLILVCHFNAGAQDNAQTAERRVLVSPYETDNMLGFSGIDLGLRYGRYNVIPRDPYTGNSMLQPGANGSTTKVIQKVNMYTLNIPLYGSFIGRRLLRKKDRKLVMADISEFGLDLGWASESGKQFDGAPIHSLTGKAGPNNTVGAFITIGTGVLVAYRINNDMRVSLRYQYLIDQGIILQSWLGLDDTKNFDMSRKLVTGTFAYKRYMADASVGLGWKYGTSPHGNNSWALGIKKRIGGENKHIGLKMDFVYQRKSPQSGTRNWHSIMFYYGVGI